MKKIVCLLLIALLLAGCRNTPAETTAPAETTVPQESTQAPVLELETSPVETAPGITIGPLTGDEIAFTNPGKLRLEYTGNRSFVQYITSVEQLPGEEALKGYDAAFFEENALLILVETVNSGSVRLELESIIRSGDDAYVNLSRTMEGEMGTADMATWLLWAEVEKGLDCDWQLANAIHYPNNELPNAQY